ncbi:uncharacterized protein HKW66_Vig0161160 [Vigna angularis]|uniref:Uncharacterized protein n=1 Tax=Phaseolus angularis TaxID=3914 RepID=A0A8T0JJE5_PHAAN|nr:uncharacterized protein HKW66_Vig0161160 [Vigna angularis]
MDPITSHAHSLSPPFHAARDLHLHHQHQFHSLQQNTEDEQSRSNGGLNMAHKREREENNTTNSNNSDGKEGGAGGSGETEMEVRLGHQAAATAGWVKRRHLSRFWGIQLLLFFTALIRIF